MEKMKIEIEVSKPFYEIALEIKSLVADVHKALADGVQVQDAVNILLPRITRFQELKTLVEAIPAELKQPWDVAQALTAGLEGIEEIFVKPSAE